MANQMSPIEDLHTNGAFRTHQTLCHAVPLHSGVVVLLSLCVALFHGSAPCNAPTLCMLHAKGNALKIMGKA